MKYAIVDSSEFPAGGPRTVRKPEFDDIAHDLRLGRVLKFEASEGATAASISSRLYSAMHTRKVPVQVVIQGTTVYAKRREVEQA